MKTAQNQIRLSNLSAKSGQKNLTFELFRSRFQWPNITKNYTRFLPIFIEKVATPFINYNITLNSRRTKKQRNNELNSSFTVIDLCKEF